MSSGDTLGYTIYGEITGRRESKWLSLLLAATAPLWFSISDAQALSEQCLTCEPQCVTYAKDNLPTDSKWRNIPVGSAVGWWQKAGSGEKGSVPKAQSLIVFADWQGNQYGHISLIKRIDGNVLTVSHANWKCKCEVREDKFLFDQNRMIAKYLTTQKDYRILGFLYVWPQQEIEDSVSGENTNDILGNLTDSNRYNAIQSKLKLFHKGLTPDELVAVRGKMFGNYWSGSVGQLAGAGKIKGSLSGGDAKTILGNMDGSNRFNAIRAMLNMFHKGLTPAELVAVRGKMFGNYWSGSVGQLAGAGKIKSTLSGGDAKTILGNMDGSNRYNAIRAIATMLNKNLNSKELIALRGNMSQSYWGGMRQILQQPEYLRTPQSAQQQRQAEISVTTQQPIYVARGGFIENNTLTLPSISASIPAKQKTSSHAYQLCDSRIKRRRKMLESFPNSDEKASALAELEKAEKALDEGNIDECEGRVRKSLSYSSVAAGNYIKKTNDEANDAYRNYQWWTTMDPFERLPVYGNWCGKNWSGGWDGRQEPINNMDELCKSHDLRYDDAKTIKNVADKTRATADADWLLVDGLHALNQSELKGKTYKNMAYDWAYRDTAITVFMDIALAKEAFLKANAKLKEANQ